MLVIAPLPQKFYFSSIFTDIFSFKNIVSLLPGYMLLFCNDSTNKTLMGEVIVKITQNLRKNARGLTWVSWWLYSWCPESWAGSGSCPTDVLETGTAESCNPELMSGRWTDSARTSPAPTHLAVSICKQLNLKEL